MKLTLTSFPPDGSIPGEHSFCVPADDGPVALGANRSPEVRWSEVPDGTQSLALTCHDPDVPSVADDVNQEGKTIPEDLPRVDFYHWVLVDIPPAVTGLAEGLDSDGVTARGKEVGPVGYAVRGQNDYTNWFAGDKDMEGTYGGYDGPCPPWNDARLHHYCFKLYALDVPSLNLSGPFTGQQAVEAMLGHVLAEAEHVGTYSLNPELQK